MFFNFVCVCFQGFGETVELPDSARVLPEPGLCLQSAAGQQTSFKLTGPRAKPVHMDRFMLSMSD